MKLPLSLLHEGENSLDYSSLKDGWVRSLIEKVEKDGCSLSGPLGIHLKLTKLENDFFMRGQLEFGLNAFCDRCAEAVKAPIRHSFELGMAREAGPRRGRTQNESEKDEAPTEEMEALDLVFFHGNEMELDPIIEEQLLLSVPYQTLCKGDCKGICAECGKNLNEAPCECKKENKLSPFSKLKSLKK